jgi:acetolactate synthase-1/2/3 large subunit
MKKSGSEIIIELLERQGIRTIPGIPGGSNLPLYDSLARSKRIRHILSRHEQGAGFIAQGMARSTGTTAVCFATSGPGATNLVTAIADAKADSVPLVAITGQVPSSLIGTDAFQEVDMYGITVPITKHNFLVRSAKELLTVLPEAFRIAGSGRPGPVVVDVPKDVQLEKTEIREWPLPGTADSRMEPSDDDLRRFIGMISSASRPVLYAGGGVVSSGASSALTGFARRFSIPVTASLLGLGSFPQDDPLWLGMLGMHGAAATNLALEEADLLIVLGARFDDRATGNIARFCPNANIIHADTDHAELGKLRKPELSIRADASAVLEKAADSMNPMDRSAWLVRIAEWKRKRPIRRQEDPRHPLNLIRTVARLAPEDCFVTTDVGQHQMWTAQAWPVQRPRSFLTSGGLGTMGFGLPAAIGAALANPGHRTICFSGDGSILMNIQELVTAAEENVNIKIVLMDNATLGLVHQQQTLFYGERLFASQFRSSPDFVKIAQGFGIAAVNLDASVNPCATLMEAISRPGPCLIHASIDAEQKVYPMVPPGAANRDMIGA